jgi:hypothetical protein
VGTEALPAPGARAIAPDPARPDDARLGEIQLAFAPLAVAVLTCGWPRGADAFTVFVRDGGTGLPVPHAQGGERPRHEDEPPGSGERRRTSRLVSMTSAGMVEAPGARR